MKRCNTLRLAEQEASSVSVWIFSEPTPQVSFGDWFPWLLLLGRVRVPVICIHQGEPAETDSMCFS
jgi:hypothetical protein